MSDSNTCRVALPRPWYVSVTALWRELDNFPALHSALKLFLRAHKLPVHHVRVPFDSWHSTVFAVLQINRVPTNEVAFADFGNELFTQLVAHRGLMASLARTLKDIGVEAR